MARSAEENKLCRQKATEHLLEILLEKDDKIKELEKIIDTARRDTIIGVINYLATLKDLSVGEVISRIENHYLMGGK